MNDNHIISAIIIPSGITYEIKDGISRKDIIDISTSLTSYYTKSQTSSSVELDRCFSLYCNSAQVSSIVSSMVDEVLQQEYGY